MSSAEFSLWIALYRRAPWDDTRADINSAIIAANIANYAGKMRADDAPPATILDYMPFADKPVEPEPDPIEFFRKL